MHSPPQPSFDAQPKCRKTDKIACPTTALPTKGPEVTNRSAKKSRHQGTTQKMSARDTEHLPQQPSFDSRPKPKKPDKIASLTTSSPTRGHKVASHSAEKARHQRAAQKMSAGDPEHPPRQPSFDSQLKPKKPDKVTSPTTCSPTKGHKVTNQKSKKLLHQGPRKSKAVVVQRLEAQTVPLVVLLQAVAAATKVTPRCWTTVAKSSTN